MSDWNRMEAAELRGISAELQTQYQHCQNQHLSLDMSRGKPCPEQLELSMGLLNILQTDSDVKSAGGVDCRNYGGVDGLPEAKALFAQMLGVGTDEIIIGGNSSLNMMYDTIARALLFGVYGSEGPWGRLDKVKFLCPSPGYDRHFAVCEQLGVEMIVVDMLEDGPDMDQVERLAGEDAAIKGIWCVPKYSNPMGTTYADETVERLARMRTKAGDFRIFWDDAYTVHHLTDHPDPLKDILAACKFAGNPDRVFIFSSTSKITFPGGGVAMMAASAENIHLIRKRLSIQTIGPDKLNQLRHVRFLKDMDHLRAHMKKQAAIIKPKFDAVLSKLASVLGGKNIASWNEPNGGYFISLNTLDGCAKDVVSMARAAGVTLTPAGATYPHGKDPRDRNIRIAPTFPSLAELEQAIDVLCLCVQIVCARKILEERGA